MRWFNHKQHRFLVRQGNFVASDASVFTISTGWTQDIGIPFSPHQLLVSIEIFKDDTSDSGASASEATPPREDHTHEHITENFLHRFDSF